MKYLFKNNKDRSPIWLAVLSGFLQSLAFPCFDLSIFIWIAYVPLLLAVRKLTFKKAFQLGFIAGLVHFVTLIYWTAYTMNTYGHLSMLLCLMILLFFASYLALYQAVFAALTVIPVQNLWLFLLVPSLWTGLEYLRGFLFSGFPWEFSGYALYQQLHFIQIADLCGVYGVSFIIMLTNTGIFIYLRAANKLTALVSLVFTILCLLMVWGYGEVCIRWFENQKPLSFANITIVQGNIDQKQKWDARFVSDTIRKYIDLSLSAKNKKSDLVVWPETAVPFYFEDANSVPFKQMVLSGARTMQTAFLVGSPSFSTQNDQMNFFNSAYLISRQGKILDRYDKTHLVPFGEYVPLKQYLPFLGKIVAQVGDFKSGTMGRTLSLASKKINLGIQICYEMIFPELATAMINNNKKDADLLINITNDAWYGRTSAAQQHFSMAVLRAVENRRSLVRAANTGISGFIDPLGHVLVTTALFETAVLTQKIPLMKTTSFYSQHGDWGAQICLIIVILSSLYLFYQTYINRRKQNEC